MKPLKTFEETLAEEMKDPEFREEFIKASAELDEFLKFRKLREDSGLSQNDVASRMGTSQSAVARIESGFCNGKWPSIASLQKYAAACGKRLEINFV